MVCLPDISILGPQATIQARIVCLICIPSALGPAARGLRVDISGRPRVPVLQILCITLPFHANDFTIFIVVLITFDCGFKYDVYSTFLTHLASYFSVFIYQLSVFVGTDINYRLCIHIVLSLYIVGDYM